MRRHDELYPFTVEASRLPGHPLTLAHPLGMNRMRTPCRTRAEAERIMEKQCASGAWEHVIVTATLPSGLPPRD